MENQSAPWPERFGLTSCPAVGIDPAIPPAALGVAVIFTPATAAAAEKVFLVIESRAGSLRSQCTRRLQTPKLPPPASLHVAFHATPLPDTSAAAVHAACRQQLVLSAELRRELRPAMR